MRVTDILLFGSPSIFCLSGNQIFFGGEERKGPGTHCMCMHWHDPCICHRTMHTYTCIKYGWIYDNIQFPQIILGSLGACACNVYQTLFPSILKKGPEYEASNYGANFHINLGTYIYSMLWDRGEEEGY